MNKNLVSIIMPSFNSASYIGGSINSVLEQTWKNFELIVVDDGSSDDTCKLVQHMAEKDQRIRLIALGRNNGAATARNVAIEAAAGRFIAFLDSDDRWSKEKLDLQVNTMLRNEYPLSCTGYTMLRASGKRKNIIPPELITRSSLLSGCDIGCLTAMIDVAAVGKKIYMRNIKKRHDYLLWLDVLALGGVALGIPDVLAVLHMRNESLSSSKLSAARHQWLVYRRELDMALASASYHFVRYAFHGVIKHKFNYEF
jgi:teichuronic acid biosynthesis glycosyltransferase TuaG